MTDKKSDFLFRPPPLLSSDLVDQSPMRIASLLRTSGHDIRWLHLGLLIGRVGFATSLIWLHGYAKLPALLSGPNRFFDPLGLGPAVSLALATFAEVVCAILLALGSLGRWPCVPLVLNFAVIVFVLHEAQVPGDRGELALLYLVAFSMLLVTGPGRYTVSAWLKGRRGT